MYGSSIGSSIGTSGGSISKKRAAPWDPKREFSSSSEDYYYAAPAAYYYGSAGDDAPAIGGPTASERRFDPLMSDMRRELIGTDYSGSALVHSARLGRIDAVLDALKAQGRVPECTVIDKPLQRAALRALLEPLYAPHRARQLPAWGGPERSMGRHGVVSSDPYFFALTEHLKRDGFTPEASAAFDNHSEQARADHLDYTWQLRNKVFTTPDPAVVAAQQAARHAYVGDDDFATPPRRSTSTGAPWRA